MIGTVLHFFFHMLDYFSTMPAITRKHLFLCISMFTSAQLLQQSTQILAGRLLVFFHTFCQVLPMSVLLLLHIYSMAVH
jgi:hypothetical protein